MLSISARQNSDFEVICSRGGTCVTGLFGEQIIGLNANLLQLFAIKMRGNDLIMNNVEIELSEIIVT